MSTPEGSNASSTPEGYALRESELDRAIYDLMREYAIAVENLTRDQLAEAIKQAIQSGDLMRHVSVGSRQAVTYAPFREQQHLKARVEILEAALKQATT